MKSVITLLFILAFFHLSSQNATINIVATNNKRDTLQLALLQNELVEDIRFIPIVLNKKGIGRAVVNVDGVKSFAIAEDRTYYYIKGIIAPGVNIIIKYDGNDIKNSVNYRGRDAAATIIFNGLRASNNPDSAAFTQQILVNKNLIGNEQSRFLLSVLDGKLFWKNHSKEEAPLPLLQSDFSPNLQYSFSAISNVYNVLNTNTELKHKKGEITGWYRHLNNLLPASIRNQVLCLFILDDIKSRNTENIHSIISSITDTAIKQFLHKKLSASKKIMPGMFAPDFDLENTEGKHISLGSLKGKIIYLDFWFAGCIPCEILYNKTASVREQFKNDSSVVFLNVSIDEKPQWLKAVREKNILGINVYTQNQGREHSIVNNYNIEGYPSVFLIDKKGIIRIINPSDKKDLLTTQIENLKL